MLPLKVTDDETILERCCGVPTRRYSVFEGLTTSRFDESQPQTESRADDKRDKVSTWSCDEKEMYNWVSSAYMWSDKPES